MSRFTVLALFVAWGRRKTSAPTEHFRVAPGPVIRSAEARTARGLGPAPQHHLEALQHFAGRHLGWVRPARHGKAANDGPQITDGRREGGENAIALVTIVAPPRTAQRFHATTSTCQEQNKASGSRPQARHAAAIWSNSERVAMPSSSRLLKNADGSERCEIFESRTGSRRIFHAP